MTKQNKFRTLFFLLSIIVVGTACSLPRVVSLIPEQPTDIPSAVVQEVPTTLPPQTSETILVPEYAALEGSLEALYEKYSPGVVSLQYTSAEGSGQGTGFVIDKEGHIVTNYHVANASINSKFTSHLVSRFTAK